MANPEHLAILRKGVDAWNQWRKYNPEIQPCISDVDLFGANFSGVDFSDVYLCCVQLNWVDISNANLSNAYLLDVDLSNANLSKSCLINIDLCRVILSNANLSNVNLSGMNFSRFNCSSQYIHDPSIDCSAMIDEIDISNSNFSSANLSNANLEGIDLSKLNIDLTKVNFSGANLAGSNISKINFSNANFSNTNLERTNALETNFKNADLTGACIEHWNINSKTNFSNVICDHIYLKQNQQERRPHNSDKIFAPGEFSKLFKQVIETVDLVFSDGINWQAFLHSFQKLQIECNSEELAIQAIEKKSGGSFVIRVEVPSDANKAEIEEYLKNEYQLKLQSIEKQHKLELGAKEEQINIYCQHQIDLLEIIKREANRPINSNNYMSSINYYHSGSGDNVGRDKNINNIHESIEITQTIEDIQALLKKLE